MRRSYVPKCIDHNDCYIYIPHMSDNFGRIADKESK